MSNSKSQTTYTLISGIMGGLILTLFTQPLIFAQSDNVVTETSTVSINLFQAFILGLIQGLTEFLPISSTAHLKVIPVALGWGDPGVAYTAIIQLGSIIAVLWYFRQDLIHLTTGILKSVKTKNYNTQEFKMGLGIIIGTIPIIIVGLALKILVPDLDNSSFRSLTTIAIASIVMAILLGVAEKISTHKRNFEQLSTKDGILMGLAQSLALIPGVSRSGSTITAGLFMNLERETAARFSFLLGIPAITLAGLVELKDAFSQGLNSVSIFPLVVGVISAWIFSYLAIAWLILFLQKQNTWVFVWYRLVFGIVILVATIK
ncbi:MAG: undecaprenyl-diphosphate phosphatase [Cyanobacteria bacterium]|nr:undecaprenyl-diphosphate phosphatase [Cyanobacteria bacterium CG_2015-16_32_12]NCO79404.1 undecaprenyl-diphosphate phosphatase [Cyanobacteria bacterium CG_2015-22_32_23]NCQ03408.1 undecaprenyl-diphosphate phosphatase [Cyanobacteria bacterium CG_2015-09_32_10]NCQ42339.1 undecaprenyl-diphosphate phosphatase [Cyanobacteria bacterium CG_2015-04_32_10]NCS85724.1 undecaprenyl-diphosphate phosphatase [Cyanobacteria bacterium CG_2015-02_32_10]